MDTATRIPDGTVYDVAVIGAGINGAASAKILADAGYKVLLIDKADFGSGSSSRSSRLLHCGLNYLAMARDARTLRGKLQSVALARAMMIERERLHRQLGPHRFTPTTMYIPIRKNDPVRGWQFDFAFAFLKALGGRSVPLDYRRLAQGQLGQSPLSKYMGDDLIGLVSYTELAFNWPERICVDYALAAASKGATVLNYTTLSNARRRGDGWALTLAASGSPEASGEVRARAVVNMAGVWSDEVNRFLNSASSQTVTPNKGCHIAIRLPSDLQGIGVVDRNALGHMYVCLPWKDFHIVGPTESALRGTEPRPTAESGDLDKIVKEIGRVMPGVNASADDALFRWAGMRPATFEQGNPIGTWGRKVYIEGTAREPLWLSISWGRLADHGITARDVLSEVSKRFRPDSAPAGAPGDGAAGHVSAGFADRSLDEIVANEFPRSVADVMFRRTGWGWGSDLGLPHLGRVAEALARKSGDRSARDYADEYHRHLAAEFGFEARPSD